MYYGEFDSILSVHCSYSSLYLNFHVIKQRAVTRCEMSCNNSNPGVSCGVFTASRLSNQVNEVATQSSFWTLRANTMIGMSVSVYKCDITILILQELCSNCSSVPVVQLL